MKEFQKRILKMEKEESIVNVYPFKDLKSSTDPILNYNKNGDSILVIDNGKKNIFFFK